MIAPNSLNLIADIDFALSYTGWVIAAIVVAIGLLGFGLADLAMFSPRRVWAISGVCFRESIRKRVLWITPLAILGVIVVCQLQRALDEQDAINQTVKYCLFATGLVVTLSCIILACTNLPKEIENRVIFTVVTKPTTRLEIVLGKIVGFARVSAAILIIMGIFTYAYCHIRAIGKQADINARINGEITQAERDTLVHYQQTGLLNAREYSAPTDVQVMAVEPNPKSPVRCTYGDGEQDILIPFDIDHETWFGANPNQGAGESGLLLLMRVGWNRYGVAANGVTPSATTLPTTAPSSTAAKTPAISVNLWDENLNSFVLAQDLRDPTKPETDKSGVLQLPLPQQNEIADPVAAMSTQQLPSLMPVAVFIPADVMASRVYNHKHLFVHIAGYTDKVQYFVDDAPAVFLLPKAGQAKPETIAPAMGPDGKPVVIIRGRLSGTGGQQVRGGSDGTHTPVAIFHFRGGPAPTANSAGMIPFDVRSSVEHGGEVTEEEMTTHVTLTVHDNASGKSATQTAAIENRRSAFISVPAGTITSGDFDVAVKCDTDGHFLGVDKQSLSLVLGEQGFGLNLFKSLLIIWLMTLLVVTVSVFCSTFLSWPIAVVLTVVILLGRWGVDQLSDTAQAGLGAQIATEFFGNTKDAAGAAVVSTTVDQLTSGLNWLAKVLPDIEKFAASDDIERGVAISNQKLIEPLFVLLGFGVPTAVLAYVFLKNKEVAP
jgi:ABC-type transport system involved in multi-copper enzyme maturation permease subunit